MNTCDKCKYYEYPMGYQRGRCNNENITDDGIDAKENGLLALAIYGEGAVIAVGPKFGCILYVKRES